MVIRLRPAEQKLYDALADGRLHKISELCETLGMEDSEDEGIRKSNKNALYQQVYQLKLKLAIVGEDIICQKSGYVTGYRRVITLKPSTSD